MPLCSFALLFSIYFITMAIIIFLSLFFFYHRKEITTVSSFSFLYRRRRKTRRTVCVQSLFICRLIRLNFISIRFSIKFL
jgi:hypothetical protein